MANHAKDAYLTWRTRSRVPRSHSCERLRETCSHECEHRTQECVRHKCVRHKCVRHKRLRPIGGCNALKVISRHA
jgi:hypothetical protein